MIWKDIKTTFFIYSSYECVAVEEYLEQMADKGWLLQGVKGPFFKFKKIIRQKLKYSVDVLNKISVFDSIDTVVALEYREYCQAAGWTYICQTGKIQIFYAEEDTKITPLHTDEDEKFKTVFKSSLYEMINQLFIVLLLIFNIHTQSSDTSYLLSSNYSIFLVVVMFSIVFINIIKFISFFLWVIKSRRKLKENKFMPYNNYKQLRIKNILAKTYMILLLLALFSFLVFDDYTSKNAHILVLIIVLIFTICLQIFIKEKKYSKTTNIIITISSSIASIFLVLILLVSAALWNIPEVQQKEISNETSTLTLMDFGYTEINDEDNYTDFNKSVLAKSAEYSFGTKSNYLSYELLQSKYPWVVEFHENRLLNRIKERNTDLMKEYTDFPSNIKVYSYKNKKNFILVSDNKVVNITKGFSNISDDEFLNIVYKKLFSE